MNYEYQWVSKDQIEAAKISGKKCCKLCRRWGVPGFVLNALQWVHCWGCGK